MCKVSIYVIYCAESKVHLTNITKTKTDDDLFKIAQLSGEAECFVCLVFVNHPYLLHAAPESPNFLCNRGGDSSDFSVLISLGFFFFLPQLLMVSHHHPHHLATHHKKHIIRNTAEIYLIYKLVKL